MVLLSMNMIFLPIIAALCYALSGFIDNYLVDAHVKKLHAKCMSPIYMALEIIACAAILIITRGSVLEVSAGGIAIFFGAAAFNSLASLPYYAALKRGETTEVSLLSQAAPIIALVLGVALLGESIGAEQLAAFFLIIGSAVFLVLGSGSKHIKLKMISGGYVLLACLFWVLSDIVFVLQARESAFITSFFWLLLGGLAANAVQFAIMKSWRRDFKTFISRNRAKKVAIITVNELVWGVGEVAWRFGVVMLPVAIVSVTGNVSQLIITFVLGILLSSFFPRFGREKLTKKIVVNHALATVTIGVALVILG
jgi:drug/metabolite transporter (DMT)-like permease